MMATINATLPGAACRMQRTPVLLNNSALSYFVRGDYGQAVKELSEAYELCQHRLHWLPQSNVTDAPPSVVSATDSAIDRDRENKDNVRMAEDDCVMDEDRPLDNTPTTTFKGKNITTNLLRPMDDSGSENDAMNQPSRSTALGVLSLSCCPASPSPTASAGSAFTMYNRALVLSHADENEKPITRTGAIILYNLALVYHNIGMHLGISACLWQALRLYEQALEILDRQLPREGEGTLSNTTICWYWRIMDVEKLLLALLNNMGNIHAYLFHLENTNACMKSLRLVLEVSTATSLLTHVHGSTSSPIAKDEDYIFFLLNSLFQEKALGFAPAA